MKQAFQSIAIVGRQRTFGVVETILSLFDYLKPFKVKIFLDQETALIVSDSTAQTITRDRFAEYCDLVIVVGGDGSMLDVAPCAARQNLPVLGINRGYLGFLTDIHPEKFAKVGKILNGEFREERRFLLEARIIKDDAVIFTETVLNDVVLSGGITTKLVEFAIRIDGDAVCDYRADGLIIATPTGSTAYALSGGGPIMHPDLDALVLVPIFSHNLSSRPMVIGAKSTVDMMVARSNLVPLSISCDGRERITITQGGIVNVRRAPHQLRLIHPLDYNYFSTLRSKLNWQK